MPRKTVLLADLPATLEDLMVSMFENRPNLKVVRGAAADGDLAMAAAAANAQVVVVTRRDPANLGAVDPRLERAAGISIIALAPHGTTACVHVLRTDATKLEDVSTEDIFTVLEAC